MSDFNLEQIERRAGLPTSTLNQALIASDVITLCRIVTRLQAENAEMYAAMLELGYVHIERDWYFNQDQWPGSEWVDRHWTEYEG